MRVILHAGMQKTGSSALQDYLARHRDRLAESGVLYPDFGHRGHWLVASAFVAHPTRSQRVRKRLDEDEAEAELATVREQLCAIAKTARATDVLILSHEGLSNAQVAVRLCDFLSELDGVTSVHVLAYIRNPVSHFPSALQQALKSGKLQSFLPSQWLSPHLARADQLVLALGDRLTLRLYAPVSGWNVIEDFCEFCLARTGKRLPPIDASPVVNSSLSAAACALLALPPDADANSLKKLRQAVRKFDATQRGKGLIVPAAWAVEIAATNALAWNRIIELTDAAEATKKAGKLSAEIPVQACSEDDLNMWLGSGFDPAYTNGLADFCRDNPRARAVAATVDAMAAQFTTAADPASSTPLRLG